MNPTSAAAATSSMTTSAMTTSADTGKKTDAASITSSADNKTSNDITEVPGPDMVGRKLGKMKYYLSKEWKEQTDPNGNKNYQNGDKLIGVTYTEKVGDLSKKVFRDISYQAAFNNQVMNGVGEETEYIINGRKAYGVPFRFFDPDKNEMAGYNLMTSFGEDIGVFTFIYPKGSDRSVLENLLKIAGTVTENK